jgi:hypothetical protein
VTDRIVAKAIFISGSYDYRSEEAAIEPFAKKFHLIALIQRAALRYRCSRRLFLKRLQQQPPDRLSSSRHARLLSPPLVDLGDQARFRREDEADGFAFGRHEGFLGHLELCVH